MSDVERIVEEHQEKVRKAENKERIRLKKALIENRKLDRFVARFGFWGSGVATILAVATATYEAWGMTAFCTAAGILLYICGRCLE